MLMFFAIAGGNGPKFTVESRELLSINFNGIQLREFYVDPLPRLVGNVSKLLKLPALHIRNLTRRNVQLSKGEREVD